MKNNILLEKSYKFAIRIVKLSQFLMNNRKEFVMSRQILKSGTSVGANAEEANGAQSKADFIAKIFISHKETRETHFWLRLLNDTGFIEKELFESLIFDCDEILKITGKILATARK